MNLPLVDTFSSPYEAWEERNATLNEVLAAKNPHLRVRIRHIASISSAYDAAVYMATVGADPGLGRFINAALDQSVAHKSWQQAMPPKTPDELSRYQKFYPHCNFQQVSEEIAAVGHLLSDGQSLFHAGLWPNGSHLITDRPLSTTFCPQIALRNAAHQGKAYDASQIDLFVLKANNPRTKVFGYKRKGTNLGHENEVVFAAGAALSLTSTVTVNSNYPVGKYGCPDKQIVVRVLGVDIS